MSPSRMIPAVGGFISKIAIFSVCRIDKKNVMPYKVWEHKLRVKLQSWYKVFADSDSDVEKVRHPIILLLTLNRLNFLNRIILVLFLETVHNHYHF